MDHLCQIAVPQWTDKETKEYVKNCNTSFSITKENGKERINYRACALLNANGLPIPLDEFMVKSGQRVMLQPIEKPYRRHEEYLAIQSAKKEWNKANKGRVLFSTKSFSQLRLIEEMSNKAN